MTIKCLINNKRFTVPLGVLFFGILTIIFDDTNYEIIFRVLWFSLNLLWVIISIYEKISKSKQ
jgi:hypothetical protein